MTNRLFVILLYCAFLFYIPIHSQEIQTEDIAVSIFNSTVTIISYDLTGCEIGIGTGFFIDNNKILTNAHVIEEAYSIEIRSQLNTYEIVTILVIDQDVDLALLKVESNNEIPLSFAYAKSIRVGQKVLAIGNPFGLENTITDGIISAIRDFPDDLQLIQTSAPISPGNSGGPLINKYGEVIGVNSLSLVDGQNINFAIGLKSIQRFLKLPHNPQILNKAKSKVYWRYIWRKIFTGILLVLGILLSGSWYWIILIIIFAFYILFYIFQGMKWIYIKIRNMIFHSEGGDNISIGKTQSNEFTDYSKKNDDSYSFFPEDSENTEISDVGRFYCWQCGQEVVYDLYEKENKIKCDNCGVILKIPDS